MGGPGEGLGRPGRWKVWAGWGQAFSVVLAGFGREGAGIFLVDSSPQENSPSGGGCVERGFWGVEKRGFGGVWVRVWGVGGGLVRVSWKSIADFARTARWIKRNCQGLQ